MDGIVFHPAAKHLNRAVKFFFPADNGLKFVFSCHGGKVYSIAFKGASFICLSVPVAMFVIGHIGIKGMMPRILAALSVSVFT
jgi:hypothetical protein